MNRAIYRHAAKAVPQDVRVVIAALNERDPALPVWYLLLGYLRSEDKEAVVQRMRNVIAEIDAEAKNDA